MRQQIYYLTKIMSQLSNFSFVFIKSVVIFDFEVLERKKKKNIIKLNIFSIENSYVTK